MYLKYFKYFSSKEASEAVEEDELHEAGFWGDQQRDHRWRVAGDKTDLTIYQKKKLKKIQKYNNKKNRSHYHQIDQTAWSQITGSQISLSIILIFQMTVEAMSPFSPSKFHTNTMLTFTPNELKPLFSSCGMKSHLYERDPARFPCELKPRLFFCYELALICSGCRWTWARRCGRRRSRRASWSASVARWNILCIHLNPLILCIHLNPHIEVIKLLGL